MYNLPLSLFDVWSYNILHRASSFGARAIPHFPLACFTYSKLLLYTTFTVPAFGIRSLLNSKLLLYTTFTVPAFGIRSLSNSKSLSRLLLLLASDIYIYIT